MSNYGESYYPEEIEEMKKEKVVTIIPDKQVVIDKSDLEFIYKQKADLEAKLAESEAKIACREDEIKFKEADINQLKWILEGKKKDIDQLKQQLEESESESNARYSAWQEEIGECNRLRVALAEKDAEVQSWKDGTMVVKLGKLEEQLAEKEKEVEELKKGVYKVTLGTTPSNQIDFTENFYVIQNQTAITELEKVIKFMKTRNKWGFFPKQNDIADYINQQIKSLKGEK